MVCWKGCCLAKQLVYRSAAEIWALRPLLPYCQGLLIAERIVDRKHFPDLESDEGDITDSFYIDVFSPGGDGISIIRVESVYRQVVNMIRGVCVQSTCTRVRQISK